jgi:hypothetical protein
MPEYRAWITIPGLAVDASDESQWMPLLDALRRDHDELGPILGGDAHVQVVVATDAPDEASAAGELHAAVVDSLRAAGLEHLYPSALELQLVDADERAAA